MVKKFEWKKKEGEDWYELKADLQSLDLNQSLKVQEMFDNKNHQRLQEKFNRIIIILTAFIVLGGIFDFVIVSCEKFDMDPTIWFWVFGFAFLIASLSFLYVVLPKGRVIKSRETQKNKEENSKKSIIKKIRDLFDKINLFNLEFLGELSLILGAIIIGGYIQNKQFSILLGILLILFYIIIKIKRNPRHLWRGTDNR
ncbi:MAG: hypothetical protein PHH54_03885 [Candidatus Nanoarchaeia archaeon]|nr:hypothetical protein [Candidatus Nanoarchaeia archaeon]MDD5741100.1 hypothetical protein [Candidatus Nanoarchaeia archaeon]